jgi:hypothetical protein
MVYTFLFHKNLDETLKSQVQMVKKKAPPILKLARRANSSGMRCRLPTPQ